MGRNECKALVSGATMRNDAPVERDDEIPARVDVAARGDSTVTPVVRIGPTPPTESTDSTPLGDSTGIKLDPLPAKGVEEPVPTAAAAPPVVPLGGDTAAAAATPSGSTVRRAGPDEPASSSTGSSTSHVRKVGASSRCRNPSNTHVNES
jgi:hypothetical protein